MMISLVHVMKIDYSTYRGYRERQKRTLRDNQEIHFNLNVAVHNCNRVISFDKPSFGKN